MAGEGWLMTLAGHRKKKEKKERKEKKKKSEIKKKILHIRAISTVSIFG